jgi:hypothetical protein
MEAEMSNGQQPYLSSAQIYDLNEKHGWFEFGDAQSDVSRAFAQDAIEMHERIRAAAPELLEALEGMVKAYDDGVQPDWALPYIRAAHAALTKARGA